MRPPQLSFLVYVPECGSHCVPGAHTWGPEEGTVSLGMELQKVMRCRVEQAGPSEEQSALMTAEPVLQPWFSFLS